MSLCTCVCTLLWASLVSLRGEQSNEGSDRWTEKQIGDGWTDIKSSHFTGFLSPIRAATLFPPMKTKHISFINTSKGSYRSWKKNRKSLDDDDDERGNLCWPIFSCSSTPYTSPGLPLPLPSTRSPSSPSTHPCSVHPCELKWKTRVKKAKRELKQQNLS